MGAQFIDGKWVETQSQINSKAALKNKKWCTLVRFVIANAMHDLNASTEYMTEHHVESAKILLVPPFPHLLAVLQWTHRRR